jgi:hypothetical protein
MINHLGAWPHSFRTQGHYSFIPTCTAHKLRFIKSRLSEVNITMSSFVVNARLSDGTSVSVSFEADPSTFTVLDLKKEIVPKALPGFPPEDQKIVYRGRILKDGETLEAAGMFWMACCKRRSTTFFSAKIWQLCSHVARIQCPVNVLCLDEWLCLPAHCGVRVALPPRAACSAANAIAFPKVLSSVGVLVLLA